jgi:hypothetical protein
MLCSQPEPAGRDRDYPRHFAAEALLAHCRLTDPPASTRKRRQLEASQSVRDGRSEQTRAKEAWFRAPAAGARCFQNEKTVRPLRADGSKAAVAY